MKIKQHIVVFIFLLACCILTGLLFVHSMHHFLEISPKGLPNESLSSLPDWARGFFKGFPSPVALLCYCLFAFSAFLLLKEKRKGYKTISIISFVLLIFLFLFFL